MGCATTSWGSAATTWFRIQSLTSSPITSPAAMAMPPVPNPSASITTTISSPWTTTTYWPLTEKISPACPIRRTEFKSSWCPLYSWRYIYLLEKKEEEYFVDYVRLYYWMVWKKNINNNFGTICITFSKWVWRIPYLGICSLILNLEFIFFLIFGKEKECNCNWLQGI